MESRSNLATLVHIARQYYEENMSQQEIADQLGVSRSLIALYLKRAHEQNIVRIEIVNPQDECEDLALEIRDKTGINSVHVIPKPSNPELVQRSLAGAVARYLENVLVDGNLIGLGWGRTITEVVRLIAPSKPRRVEVVPLLGESSFTSTYTQLNQLILQFAQCFNGAPYFLFVPLLVGSSELKDALLRDEVARPVAERWERLDIACVGIGAIPPAPGQILYLGEDNVKRYADGGAIGDLVARHFNRDGQILHTDIDERIIGIDLGQLKKAKKVVVVARGLAKAKAVQGALRLSLITDLFIDEELAQVLLTEL
jgi:deoxyribonucleoside regulator